MKKPGKESNKVKLRKSIKVTTVVLGILLTLVGIALTGVLTWLFVKIFVWISSGLG